MSVLRMLAADMLEAQQKLQSLHRVDRSKLDQHGRPLPPQSLEYLAQAIRGQTHEIRRCGDMLAIFMPANDEAASPSRA